MSDGVYQIDVVTTADGVDAGINKAKSALGGLGAEADKAKSKLNGIGDGAEKSSAQMSRAYGRIESEIKRVTAAAQASADGTGRSGEILNKAVSQGLDASRIEPQLQKLRELEKSTVNLGMSAKQTAFALRGVPAQFTDIFTSLAAGQNPMMVVLQQGGQLKDMFGGVGGAVKAMGSYILGMINPMTIAAATATALGVAFYQGSEEARNLAKAITLTGNAAGTSVNQLSEVSAAVSASSGATKGAVNEALNAIINTGGVASSSLGKVAEASLKMSKATGESIDETVKKFSDLGKDPVKASEKLNEQYNYLTSSVYKQIKALEDQGRVTEAAALAQNTFADAISGRSDEVIANIGNIERAWKGIAGTAKSAWDAMLGVGRDQDDINARMMKALATVQGKGGLDGGSFFASKNDAMTELAVIDALLQAEQKKTKEKTTQNEANAAGLAMEKEAEKYATKGTQKQLALTKAANEYRTAIAGAVGDQQKMNEVAKTYETIVSGINEKFTDKKTGKSQAVKDAEALASLLDRLHGQDGGEFNSDYVDNVQKLVKGWSSGTLSLAKYNQEFSILRSLQPGYKAELKAQEDATKAAAKSEAEYTKALYANDDALVKKAEALEYEVEFYGKEDSAINAVIASRMSEARVIAEANGAYPEHLAFLDREIEARNRISEASGKKEVLDKSSKEMDEFAKSAARNIQTTFADFLFDPFADGTKSMGEKFAISLRRMMADAASAKLMSALLGDGKKDRGLIGSFDWSKLFSGSSSSSGATGLASLGSSVNTGFANGGVFNSPSLHSYSGQIHDTPQMFKFAQGGVFGEAGPEAIMPLKRDSSGRLGVSSGGGGNVSVQINNYSGQSVQQKEVPDGRGGRRIEVTVGDMVAAEMRRTGSAANKALSQPRMVSR